MEPISSNAGDRGRERDFFRWAAGELRRRDSLFPLADVAAKLAAAQVASEPEPIFQAFACEICKQDGHYCPGTRLGFEQEGVQEHWCAACKAGFKCAPGTGARDKGGKSKARKLRAR